MPSHMLGGGEHVYAGSAIVRRPFGVVGKGDSMDAVCSRLLGLYERDMVRRGLRPRSVARILSDLRHFGTTHGALTGATRESIESWLDSKHVGPRTRYKWLSVLHAFYTWAYELNHMAEVPTRFIVRPKVRRTLPRPISNDDLRSALAHASPEMRCLLLLGALAGLRCQEMAGLDGEDVLVDEGLLRIVHGKGGNERLVPLHPDVLAALRLHGLPATGPVFRSPRSLARYAPGAMSQRINVHLHGLGIVSSAHSLRHRFLTDVYAASNDLRVTQELAGHQSPTTTAIYTQFSQVSARKAVLALGAPEPREGAAVVALQRTEGDAVCEPSQKPPSMTAVGAAPLAG